MGSVSKLFCALKEFYLFSYEFFLAKIYHFFLVFALVDHFMISYSFGPGCDHIYF
jgi:hypothetical protein